MCMRNPLLCCDGLLREEVDYGAVRLRIYWPSAPYTVDVYRALLSQRLHSNDKDHQTQVTVRRPPKQRVVNPYSVNGYTATHHQFREKQNIREPQG